MTTTRHLEHLAVPSGHLAYAVDGAGTPPVVLLHAGYTDHRMYDRELEHLAMRTTVVAPDARTHGRSSTALEPFRHCDDVAALVRHLNLGPAVLVGTSMGAGTAVDTALEHPETVHALVLSGAGTNEPVFESAAALELLRRSEEAIAAQDVTGWLAATLEWMAGPARSLDDVDPQARDRVASLHRHFVGTHLQPGVVPPEHVTGSWDRLGEISVPVLGIVGELDFTDHHRMTERAVAGVRDGRGVVRIPGAGHYPNLEQPLAWEHAVDDFLDEVLTG
ncbi:alpha/beta fold hydrolase [Ornithinimicrobium cavernae]|uniref:alpha/beta fold hydrolase n=1 Tax=Ornithinimicrobium cavernae TaxID=2666047 RepID=UPI000D69C0A8|nr:alpha/beta hydrolase [Ornithinimicrobium cavernae]